MNDCVALHRGNVGLDNLQLQTTTVTDNRQQHGGKNTVSNRQRDEQSDERRTDGQVSAPDWLRRDRLETKKEAGATAGSEETGS